MSQEKTFEIKIQQGKNYIYFKFKGDTPNFKIDYSKIDNNIDNCFENEIKTNNLTQKIAWIRTILKDFDESYLKVEILNEFDYLEQAVYENKTLKEYIKKINNQTVINFNTNNNPNLTFNIINFDLNNYENYKLKQEMLKDSINQLYTLTKITPIELTKEEKVLCLYYEAFYNEMPDFSSKDINIKMQTMMAILANFDISLSIYDNFRLNSKKTPVSLTLSKTVKKLKPLGKINYLDNTIKLTSYTQEKIKKISKHLRENIKEDIDELEFLKKFSRIIYASKNCFFTNEHKETIAKFYDYPVEEIESTLKLVKKINTN